MSIALKMGAAVVAVAGLLALAGCGSDDDEATTEASTTTEESTQTTTAESGGGGGGGETVDVSLKDYSLDPADPSVKAGTVTFDVTNDGQVTHTIEVEGPGEEAELEPDLAPGDSGSLDVDLSEPGTYEWYCPIGNHRELGMEGEITVQ